MTHPASFEHEVFPPDVVTPEQRRRWELCAWAAWVVYGYGEESPPTDGWDLQLLRGTTRTYYESEYPSGDGTITPEMRTMLRQARAL